VADNPSPITDEMIGQAAEAIRTRCAADEFYDIAEIAVRAALAGRTVVDLPEPDGQDEEMSWWEWTDGGRVQVYREGRYDASRSTRFRAQAAAMLAAADLADRQVAESSGDGCTCTRTWDGAATAVRHHDCPVHGESSRDGEPRG
jgi:hypothetical protein